MCSYSINCFNQETHKREQFEVPYDVYVYVVQLEMKIKYGDESGLFNLYPELDADPNEIYPEDEIELWKDKCIDEEAKEMVKRLNKGELT